ncbi:ChaN family lipoprotein [Marinobacterium arenosum]|uniref:ChaN family lipoprotein n=1 Tax=Marinobacterium arenosum TaxID=2862496 RepID=UPI001C970A35|nr:ChaN family lipoprotein [Marinobacterium arenosum]MBY4676996.1 ChaN family lipoprotein [Marinobacterium arenosum]
MTNRIRRLIPLFQLICLLTIVLGSSARAEPRWQAPEQQHHPLTGRIYDLNAGSFISETQLIVRLTATRQVLIGEKHDNPDHHQLEAKLLGLLLPQSGQGGAVFEMLERGQQPILDRLAPTDSLDSIKQTLEWRDNGWPWADYGPLFQATLQSGQPLIAGNLDRQQIKALYKDAATTTSTAYLQTVSSIAEPVRQRIHQQVYESHCELMPKEQLWPMVEIQLAKDASMADALLENSGQGRALLVAGAYHVRKDRGVPLHLVARDEQAKPAVLILQEVDGEQLDPADYASAEQADYLWFTPRQPAEDHCAGLKAKFGNKAEKD